MVSIFRAAPEQAVTLTEVAFAAKRYWRYPESWIAEWAPQLSLSPEWIAGHAVFAAGTPQSPDGFYALGGEPPTLSLEHLWVRPELIGRGIGRALFLHAVERAQVLGASQLEIEADPNALGFYEHMGARQVGIRLSQVAGQPRSLPLLIFQL